MIPDLGWVVASMAAGISVPIERAGLVTYDASGNATSAAPTAGSIEAVVVPKGGRQLLRLTAGDETTEEIELYMTDAAVLTARPSGAGAPRAPDVVLWSGVRYVVTTAEPWVGGGFSVVTAKREGT